MENNFAVKKLSSLGVRKTDLVFLAFCAIFLYLHLFILPATPIFFEEDHLSLIQDAWRMYLEEEIYRDFFQFVFPGTQVCYLILFKIFGTQFWTISFMIFLSSMASAIISLAISRKIFEDNWYVYLAPAIYLFFGFRWFGLDGSHRMFSPIFAMLAVLVLLNSRTLQRIIIAGFFCALTSYFTQQRGFLAVTAIGVFLFYDKFAGKHSWKEFFTKEIVLGLTFTLSLILLVIPFVLSAGLEKFLDNTIFSITNYVQDPSANYKTYLINIQVIANLGLTISAVMLFYLAIIPLIYLIVYIYLILKRNNEKVKAKSQVLLVALMGGFLTLGTLGPNPGRYFQIALPALILFVWMIYQLANRNLLIPKVAVSGLIIFGLLLSYRIQINSEKEILDTPTGKIAFLSNVTAERYKWLLLNANKDDTVFEVYLPASNFPLQLKNPTRVTFLLNTGVTPEWMVLQSIDDLESKETRFVIWDDIWTEELKTIEEGERLKPLLDYLQQKYFIREKFTPYNNRRMQLWERK